MTFNQVATGATLDLSTFYSTENGQPEGHGESVMVQAYLGTTLVYTGTLNAMGTGSYTDSSTSAGRGTVSFDTGGLVFDSLKLSAPHVADSNLSDVNDFLLNGITLMRPDFAKAGDQITLAGSQDNLAYIVQHDADPGDGFDLVNNFTKGVDKQVISLHGHSYTISIGNYAGGAANDTLITFNGVANAGILITDQSTLVVGNDLIFIA